MYIFPISDFLQSKKLTMKKKEPKIFSSRQTSFTLSLMLIFFWRNGSIRIFV